MTCNKVGRLCLLMFAAMSNASSGADLASMDRSIAREPAYQHTPQYALLAFGPENATRVWIVRDGKVLYVDRNANGDLTEPDERVVSGFSSTTSAGEEVHGFDAGDIVDGLLIHRKLRVDTVGLSRFRGRWAREFVAAHPGVCGYAVSIETEIQDGAALGGTRRVMQWVQNADRAGTLHFSASPGAAPILHFGGPLQLQHFFPMAVYENGLVRGRATDFIATLATPGVGPGSTVLTGFAGLMPSDAMPRLECEFEVSGSATPTIATFNLPERCCGCQLYGEVLVPKEVSSANVNCRLVMTGWEGGPLASSPFKVQIEDPLTVPETPVSNGLVRTLPHASPDSALCGLAFSKDGSRLCAGSVPDGIVQVWNVADGRSLNRLETGKRTKSPRPYFVLSHDDRTIFSWHTEWTAATNSLSTTVKSSLDEWDAATGSLIGSHQPAAGHGIFSIQPSPSGNMVFVSEQTATGGTSASMFELPGRRFRSLGDKIGTSAFSRDGRLQASIQAGEFHWAKALLIFDTTTGTIQRSIPITGAYSSSFKLVFGPDDRSVASIGIRYNEPLNFEAVVAVATAFDTTTGRQIWEHEFGPETEFETCFSSSSPTGQTIDLVVSDRKGRGGSELAIIDAVSGKFLGATKFARDLTVVDRAYSPDGLHLAFTTQSRPLQTHRLGPDELEQARIQLIDVSTARVLRTLVLPRGEVASLAFSPDGRTLATGSTGAVHLWDVLDISAGGGTPALPDAAR